jgi:ABC-type transport system involved in multi-copper enzyme maturation permease subunit
MFTARLGLPLLSKELVEQAARRRTYVIRVLYACLLFTAAYFLFYDLLLVGRTTPIAALGQGRPMFEVLMKLQFAGIYLVMPAVTCGVLTHEKEQNTLALLFLTKLGPWTILFEKLASRMVPMCCFLVMSLPLLAYAYSLGGITQTHLWSGVWMLFLTVLQMGALGLLCSAWSRTTVGAFVGVFAAAALTVFGPILVAIPLSSLFSGASLSGLRDSLAVRQLYDRQIIRHADEVLLPFCTPMHFFDYGWDGTMNRSGFSTVRYFVGAARSWQSIAAGSLPILLSTAVFLLLSRLFLIRRAFVPARNRLLTVFRELDGVFTRWNGSRLTRGIVLIRDKRPFPDGQPVAWRETTKRSLGRARYLIRIGGAVEAALIALLIFLIIFTDGDARQAVMMLAFSLWTMAIGIVAVQSSSLIAGERSQQTLSVLCTTPLSGRDILLEKFVGVRRVMAMLCVPLLTVILFQAPQPAQFACSIIALAIYLPLAAWLSLLVGMKVKTRGRAIIVALAAIAGWCVLPVVFIFMPLMMLKPPGTVDSPLNFSIFLSPAMIVAVNDYGDWHEFGNSPWPGMTMNFLMYATALVLIRRACLRNADRWLGRVESDCDEGASVPPSLRFRRDPVGSGSANAAECDPAAG